MPKKKNTSVADHLREMLDADKDAKKKMTPKQKLECVRLLAQEEARERADKPAEARSSQVRVPSARAQALQDRNRDLKEEANRAIAIKFFEGAADESRTDD
jgi:hypothetical protein